MAQSSTHAGPLLVTSQTLVTKEDTNSVAAVKRCFREKFALFSAEMTELMNSALKSPEVQRSERLQSCVMSAKQAILKGMLCARINVSLDLYWPHLYL